MSGIGLGLKVASVAARMAGVKGMVAKVPTPVWEGFAVLGYALALLLTHQHAVHDHDAALVKTTIASRDTLWEQKFKAVDAQAQDLRRKAEQLHANIAQEVKDQHDAQIRSNATIAADLVRGGPGKASAAAGCRPVDHPGVPATAGGPQQPAAGANAPAAPMPAGNGVSGVPVASGPAVLDPDLALVSWRWLDGQGQQFDDLLAEVVAWRTWHPKEAAAWEQMRSRLSKTTAPKP